MATYYHRHTHGFANECELWRADTQEQADALESLGFTRLTYAEARAHNAWVNAENRAWGTGAAFGQSRWYDIVHGDEWSARHVVDSHRYASRYA